VTVGELPLWVRLAFYAALLGALAVAELVAENVWVTVAVLAVFLLGVLPLIVRRFGRTGGSFPKASGRAVVAFAAVLTALTAIETVLVPDFGLGATFWIVAILIPSLEFFAWVVRSESRAGDESSHS
jgi:hypothetical protein